jgi:molecular chaperone Hsp33
MAARSEPRRTDDLIQPFQIETMAAQGRLVRLGGVVDSILGAHDYPEPVAVMLGECLTLAAVLAGGIKYDGVLTLQLNGEGPISILVADVTSAGGMRGYARFKSERVAAALADAAPSGPTQPVPLLLGQGFLAFTVDQGADTQRYQGLVALEGATLAECAHNYLRQSVQIDAAVKLAVGRVGGGGGEGAESWRSGGLMVQRAPAGDGPRISGDPVDPEEEDAWRRAVILMGSSTNDELLDRSLHPHRLLYRLFSEDGVRVFTPTALEMQCRCSRQRVARVLGSFPPTEIETMKIDGSVVVTCEFCNAAYVFDEAGLESLHPT